jgi:hypothetical protein
LNRERTYLAFASVLDVVAHGPHDHPVTEALFILVILLVRRRVPEHRGLLGAGLPALFALGVRALYGTEVATAGTPGSSRATTNSRGGRVVAYLCFGVCVAAVVFGIVVIVFGKQLFGT